MSIREFLVLLMVCTIWGLHFVVMKVTIGGTADPLFYAALRMSCVLVLTLPFLKWHKSYMGRILIAGLGYGALSYAFMFPALGMTTASAAALTIELYVPFAIILGIIFLGERVGLRRIIGIILAITGVAIIALAKPGEAAGPQYLLGIGLMACAAMSEAVGALMVKKVTGIKPLELLAWFAVVGSLVLWPLSFALEDNQLRAFSPDNRAAFLAALAYSTIAVSIMAHGSYYWLLQRLPIYIVSSSGLMTTVVAVIASIVLLGDPITPAFMAGGFITALGIGFILYARKLQGIKTLPPEL